MGGNLIFLTLAVVVIVIYIINRMRGNKMRRK